MQIEYSKLKGNFPKIVENIKTLEKQNWKTKFYLHFYKIDGSKLLLKTSSKIHYVTAPNAWRLITLKSIIQISD